MIASSLVRPAAAVIATVLLSGCSVEVQNDGHMFQRWADQVQAIPVSETPPGEAAPAPAPTATPAVQTTQVADNTLDPVALASAAGQAAAQNAGLRPAMVINLVDRINMPNAKEAGLRAAMGMVTAAAKGGDHTRGDAAGLRRAIDAAPQLARGLIQSGHADAGGRLLQLAAFPNDAAAHAAWRKLSDAHPDAFKGLAPRFEHADLGAKGQWTRLKVQAPSAGVAQRVCAAAAVRCA